MNPSAPTHPPSLQELLKDQRLPCYVDFDPRSPLGVLILTVRDHLARLGRDQRRHKRMTLNITLLTVGLSSASTVLLGLNFSETTGATLNPVWLKNCAILFTAAIAVINAYDALFKPHRLWVREGNSYGLLKDILLKLELRAASAQTTPVTDEEIEAFRSELARILQADLESWVRQHGEDLLGKPKTVEEDPAGK